MTPEDIARAEHYAETEELLKEWEGLDWHYRDYRDS
jgi:hypothetical protein